MSSKLPPDKEKIELKYLYGFWFPKFTFFQNKNNIFFLNMQFFDILNKRLSHWQQRFLNRMLEFNIEVGDKFDSTFKFPRQATRTQIKYSIRLKKIALRIPNLS